MTAQEPTPKALDTRGHRFWESFYRGRPDPATVATPNALLAEEVAALPPRTTLDLGCGCGGDAIWLASRGWTVTAADVSDTALASGARRAAAADVADAITWERHDLTASFPAGNFDLVSACFLHSPVTMDRTAVLRRAGRAVKPGGRLLVVSHSERASWQEPNGHCFPTPQEIFDDLGLPGRAWAVRRADVVPGRLTDPAKHPGSRRDNVLHLERLQP